MTSRLFEQDAYRDSCEAVIESVDEFGLVLDQSVFYARGGGQPGDTGEIILPAGTCLLVADTRKTPEGDITHQLAESSQACLADLDLVGQPVTCRIDWDRRYRHMRMHTCLHLLCAVVDAPVTGGNLTAEKGRLDFDLPETGIDKDALTAELNGLIEADLPATLEWITDEALAAQPELVKTMSVAPPTGAGRVRLLRIGAVDLQPCGGTHVRRTSEIGRVRVTKIEKKSRLNRRISVVLDD